jgi:hypothetical protein
MMVGAVNQSHARGGMPEVLAECQATKAATEDNHMRFRVLRHVTVFIH